MELREKIVQDIVRMSKFLDISEGGSMIFATILLSKKPLTMKEIKEKTGYSISSVSAYLSLLVKKNLIIKMKNVRTHLYTAKKDFTDFYISILKETLLRNIKPLKEKLEIYKNKEKEEYIEEIISKIETFEKLLEKEVKNSV
ncbi:MAG: ArsR family transcriptional regulator [Methanomicrobia archaeon]|nr:ArsR family transcriptional regulator [Methanomicrobia archaeon]